MHLLFNFPLRFMRVLHALFLHIDQLTFVDLSKEKANERQIMVMAVPVR